MASQVVSWHQCGISPVGQHQGFKSCVWGLEPSHRWKPVAEMGTWGLQAPVACKDLHLDIHLEWDVCPCLKIISKVHGSVQLAWTVKILCCDLSQRKGGGNCKQIMETHPSQLQKLFEENCCRFPATESPWFLLSSLIVSCPKHFYYNLLWPPLH